MFEKTLNFLKSVGDCINRPVFCSFYIYLILLWLLNVADTIQTLMLKSGGHLKEEANFFINYFLAYDGELFIFAKLSALIFITAMLLRGYYDKHGTTIGGHYYSPDELRRFIVLLLGGGVVYYLIIVLMPFIVLMTGHMIQGTPS